MHIVEVAFNLPLDRTFHYLIPETLRRTTFSRVRVHDRVNVEIERQTQAIVDTIRDFLQELVERHELSSDALRRIQHAPPLLSRTREQRKKKRERVLRRT